MDSEVTATNTAIVSALKDKFGNRTDIDTFALAEPVTVRGDDRTFPVILTISGEGTPVFNEIDGHDLVIYHKLQNISYTERTGFGSRRVYDRKADLSVVVLGKRTHNQYEVEEVVCKAILSDNKRVVTSSEFNATQIIATEYVGLPYFLGTDYFVFRINYSITSTCNDGCTNN